MEGKFEKCEKITCTIPIENKSILDTIPPTMNSIHDTIPSKNATYRFLTGIALSEIQSRFWKWSRIGRVIYSWRTAWCQRCPSWIFFHRITLNGQISLSILLLARCLSTDYRSLNFIRFEVGLLKANKMNRPALSISTSVFSNVQHSPKLD